jgi:hypothetical protein
MDSHDVIVQHPCRKISLKSLLNDYKYFAGLGVHWILVGPSGHKVRPFEGGALRHYKRCSKTPHIEFKLIANGFYVEKACPKHPHNFYYRCVLFSYHDNTNNRN